MPCDHKQGHWEEQGVDDWTGEQLSAVYVERPSTVDLDIGRYQCTRCGEIFYYTGQWRKFHEEGVPCVGSNGLTPQARKR